MMIFFLRDNVIWMETSAERELKQKILLHPCSPYNTMMATPAHTTKQFNIHLYYTCSRGAYLQKVLESQFDFPGSKYAHTERDGKIIPLTSSCRKLTLFPALTQNSGGNPEGEKHGC